MEIRYDGPVHPHQQIATWIRDRIRAGEFGDHDRIPVEPAIMQETGVARETVRRAMRVLRDEGWIYTVQGRGSFVSPERPESSPN